MLDAMNLRDDMDNGTSKVGVQAANEIWTDIKNQAQNLVKKEDVQNIPIIPYSVKHYKLVSLKISKTEMQNRVEHALGVAIQMASTDGAHHKMQCIDQMIRALMGCQPVLCSAVDYKSKQYHYYKLESNKKYKKFVRDYNIGVNEEYLEEPREWDTGILF